MQDLVNFRYDLALGDDVLSAEELAELARLKVPLVRVRGRWVGLDDRHLKAALKFLERKQQSGAMTAAEVLAVAMGTDGGAGELPLTEVDADGWLGDLLSGQADARLAPMATPDGFCGTLRPYQQRGLSWPAETPMVTKRRNGRANGPLTASAPSRTRPRAPRSAGPRMR